MRHHIVKNEISIGDKLQPIVNTVNDVYIGKDSILDEVINYFTEISYHLPAIYNVQVANNGYWPHITFQSHRTGGFVFRVAGNIYKYKLEFIEFHINLYETCDGWSSGRSYIYIEDVDKDEYNFKKVFKYLNAIMKNPTVATYLNIRYPYDQRFLLQNEFFTEDGNKTASDYCDKYWYYKRKKQCFVNRLDEVFLKNFYRIAKEYNNQIYKMAYKIDHLNGNIVTIRTRANLYYGDDDRYTQFVKEINSTVINGYYKWRDKIDEFENRNPDCKKIYTFGPKVVIDEIDNDNAYVPYWSLSLRKHSIKYPLMKHYYKDIVFPKRSV